MNEHPASILYDKVAKHFSVVPNAKDLFNGTVLMISVECSCKKASWFCAYDRIESSVDISHIVDEAIEKLKGVIVG